MTLTRFDPSVRRAILKSGLPGIPSADMFRVSPEALTRIKALAQRATPGPWITQDSSALGDDASFVTSGKRVEEGLLEIARVNGTEPAYGKRGDKFVREQRANAAFIAAVHPGVILAICEEIEQLRERVATLESLSGEDDACMTQLEVERDALEEQVARLEKEGDWLAARCREFCDSNNYCNECALYPGDADFPHPDCGEKIDVENARWRFEKRVVSDWREAARKAVEGAA